MRSSLIFSLILTMLGSTAGAREILFETTYDGRSIVVYSDGYWRYSDTDGVVCTPIPRLGEVCALPSHWMPIPDPVEQRDSPEFLHDGRYLAEANSYTPFSGLELTHETIRQYVVTAARRLGAGAAFRPEAGAIFGIEGPSYIFQGSGIVVFTVVEWNGRFIVARTFDPQSSLYHSGHRAAHASFTDSIRLEDYP